MLTGQFVVPGTSGTIILPPDGNVRDVTLINQGTCPVYVGESGVTFSTGLKITNGGTPPPGYRITVGPTDELVAVADGANSGLLDVLASNTAAAG